MPAQIYGRCILPESKFTFIKKVNFHNSLPPVTAPGFSKSQNLCNAGTRVQAFLVNTLVSRIYVGQRINVGPGTFGKKYKHRAANKRRA